MKTRPVSFRVTNEERTTLKKAAGDQTIGAYVRDLALEAASGGKRIKRQKQSQTRQLAQILAALGSSDMASSMREISVAARIGALSESPDVVLDIQAACLTVQKMRHELISALGLKVEE